MMADVHMRRFEAVRPVGNGPATADENKRFVDSLSAIERRSAAP